MRDPNRSENRFSVSDLSKSMVRFSWSMSLLGLQQFVNLLRPSEVTTTFDSVTRAAEEQFGQLTRGLYQTGDALQSQLIDGMFQFLTPGISRPGANQSCTPPQPTAGQAQRLAGYQNDPREEAIVRATRGTGRFSSDKKYIALQMKMYRLDGAEDGYHQGVWEANFKNPQELLQRPAPPQGPMNEPQGPVDHIPVAAYTKAHWVFGDGSSIIVVGPASSHLIPLDDGSFIFMVSTAQIITGGTGRYAGAYGLVQSLGATHIPAGVDLFGPQPVAFEATTFDTFRVIRGRDIMQQPGPAARSTSAAQPTQTPSTPSSATGQPSPDYPYQSHYVTVHGSRMHYIDEGEGDPILFLHGNPAWSYLWRNVIPHLRPYGRCIAPDLIGMGRSDKPLIKYRFFDQAKYLEGFIKRLGLRQITLVIHDWGSALGFHYAMQNQGNIKGIAFMEAMLRPYKSWDQFPATLRDTFRSFRTPGVGWELLVEQNVFVEQLLPRSVMRTLSEREMNFYREPFQHAKERTPIFMFANQLPIEGKPHEVAKAVSDYSRKLQTSTIPKLLIYAEPGAITTAPDVAWSQENLPRLQTVNIGRGIHFHQEDNPDGVGKALAEWLQRINEQDED